MLITDIIIAIIFAVITTIVLVKNEDKIENWQNRIPKR